MHATLRAARRTRSTSRRAAVPRRAAPAPIGQRRTGGFFRRLQDHACNRRRAPRPACGPDCRAGNSTARTPPPARRVPSPPVMPHAARALRHHAAIGAAALFGVPLEDVRGDQRTRCASRPAPCPLPSSRCARSPRRRSRIRSAAFVQDAGRAPAAPAPATRARPSARPPGRGRDRPAWPAAAGPAPRRWRD